MRSDSEIEGGKNADAVGPGPEWTDVQVDGIPLGWSYGIEVDMLPEDGPVRIGQLFGREFTYRLTRPVRFLTRYDGGRMVRVRELPADAVVSARRYGQPVVI